MKKEKHEFIDYFSKRFDTQLQDTSQITKTEELILKPTREGIRNLTKEELEEYMKLDIEELKKTGMNIKMVYLCQIIQELIQKDKETILRAIQEQEQRQKQEKGGEEIGD